MTKPFAYTISTNMTCNVHLVTPDTSVTGQVYIRYVVVNSWSDGHEDERRIKDKLTTLPTELAHFPPARPRVRPPYTLTQNYAFYVKRHVNSDWACAGTRTAVHPQVFLTFGQPVGPWGTKYDQQGQPVATRTCWSAAINKACNYMPDAGYTSQQQAQARQKMVEAIYYSGKTYNYMTNSRYYEADGLMVFHLWDFMPATAGQCHDFSLYWEKLCHAIGLDAQARRIDGEGGQPPRRAGFTTKPVLPANTSNWVAFSFSCHHVGWAADVYDPCVKLNQPDPLLAKGMSTSVYQGHFLDHVNPEVWAWVWDPDLQQYRYVRLLEEGIFSWLDEWRLGDPDPYHQLDTEVD